MATSKEMKEATVAAAQKAAEAVTDTMKQVTADLVTSKSDPMGKLKLLAEEYTQVNVQIMRMDEKGGRDSLFTEIPGMLLTDLLSLNPHSLAKREGGGGLWKIIYSAPDGKGKAVQVSGIKTEGRHHVIATHEAEKAGLDPCTGTPKGIGGLPTGNSTPIQIGPSPTDLFRSIQEASESTASRERQHMADIFGATSKSNEMLIAALLGTHRQNQEAPVASAQSEELRILREEIKALRDQNLKVAQDAKMTSLEQQIKLLADRLVETQKSSEIELLKARIDTAKVPAVDPTINLLTTVLGSTREDARSNTALMLELFGKIAQQPDATDKFAKVQGLLMDSAISQFQFMQQVAQAQGGPSHPAIEIFRTLAETASQYFGARGQVEEEEEEEEVTTGQLAGGNQAMQLPAPEEPEPEPDSEEQSEDEEQEEGAEMDDITPEQIQNEIQAQIARWVAGTEIIPEQDEKGAAISLTEKELDKALSSQSIDAAIRLLVSRKKPIPEITARLYALADDKHPIAVRWFTYPLPVTFQVLKHWDKKNGKTEASKHITDLVMDIMVHWAWVNETDEQGNHNDPYGRSTYRPPSAVAGVETRMHGMAVQGKKIQTPLALKQDGEEVEG